MSAGSQQPRAEAGPRQADYLALFGLYRSVLARPAEAGDELDFLFEKVVRMLSTSSRFNASLPRPFVETARRLRRGEPEAVAQLADREARGFFLSDLFDYVYLTRRSTVAR